MLKELPPIKFPITFDQVGPLMEGVVQLNLINAGINVNQQRAIGILCDTYEILAKSKGLVDYTGPAGHARLLQDAMTIAGPGTCLATRHGDLAAAHIAIDWNNCVKRLKEAGMEPLSSDVNILISQAKDLVPISVQVDNSIGVLIRMLQHR